MVITMPEHMGNEKVRPDPSLKWGVTPGKYPPAYTQPEENYSPEEQAKRQKQRDKGVDPGKLNTAIVALSKHKLMFGRLKGSDGRSDQRGLLEEVDRHEWFLWHAIAWRSESRLPCSENFIPGY